jgi:hypothetical protein
MRTSDEDSQLRCGRVGRAAGGGWRRWDYLMTGIRACVSGGCGVSHTGTSEPGYRHSGASEPGGRVPGLSMSQRYLIG